MPYIPSEEALRLKELYSSSILDTPNEKEFDDLVQLAAEICNCPIASISFIDKERQWNKARKGDSAEESPRDISMCAHTILGDDVFVIEDARQDERFSHYPYVKGGPKVVFYAGAPVYSTTGFKLGTVCVADSSQRFLTEDQKKALKLISSQVTRLLDLRSKNQQLQKRARKAEAESANRYKSFFSNGLLPQWIVDIRSFEILEVNKAAVELYGYSKHEFSKLTISDLRPAQEDAQMLQLSAPVLHGELSHPFLATHKKKNGETLQVEVTASDMLYKGNVVKVVTINDVTERSRLQEELAKAKVKEEKDVAQATLAAQEKEKEMLGKELHDNINQLLASSNLFLDLARTNEAMRMEMINKSKETVLLAITEIRKLSRSLVSPDLREKGFIAAIDALLQPFILTQPFQLHFSCWDEVEMLPNDMKLALFRIVQEQMNNIARYAAAKNVWIAVKWRDAIELSIKDDGKGFDTAVKKTGIGLRNIRNRAEAFGGKVQIHSAPGEGCYVEVLMPVEEKLISLTGNRLSC